MADQPYIPDPFASIGGGVYQNGGWVPKGFPGTETAAPAPTGPAPPAPSPSPETPTSPDPFASLGGGVYANGGWKPPGMVDPNAGPAPGVSSGLAPPGTTVSLGNDDIAGPTTAPTTPPPAATTPPPTTAPATNPNGPDPFASLGGGTFIPGVGWYPNQNLDNIPSDQLPPGAPGTGAPPPGTLTPGGPPLAPLATNARQIATPFYSTLSGLLQKPQTIDENDPQVKASLNAARGQEERNFAKQRGMLAERAAAEGTSMSGGFDTQLGNLRAGIGARQGQLAADLTQKAQTDRMAQIMSALSIGQGSMSDSDRNQLQRELAQLDASLRREGYDVSREQIGAGTEQSQAENALRRYIADQSTGLNYAQLGQQGTQFGQQLGATTGMHDQDLQQAMLIALLQGGGGG